MVLVLFECCLCSMWRYSVILLLGTGAIVANIVDDSTSGKRCFFFFNFFKFQVATHDAFRIYFSGQGLETKVISKLTQQRKWIA
jgi:hypothetical protein